MCCSCVNCWRCWSASFRVVQSEINSSCCYLSLLQLTPAMLSYSITSTLIVSESSSSRWVTDVAIFKSNYFQDVWNKMVVFPFFVFTQLFERMLRFDRVHEKNKQRLRLRESGYSGLSLLFSDLHITPTLIRCLLNQILHTGLHICILLGYSVKTFKACWSLKLN